MTLEVFTDHVTPAELTGYGRVALQDRPENQLQLSELLPDQQINDLSYRWDTGDTEGLTEAASYRTWDTEPGFGKRAGLTRATGKLPPIGHQMLLNEYDQLRLRNADQEVRDLLLRDAERITRAIDWRLEFARAEALEFGRVTIAENNVMAQLDFGRSASHSVVPATAWSVDADATPLDDIQAWTQTYVDTNGSRPGAFWTSTRVMRAMCKSKQFIGTVFSQGTVNVGQVKPSDVQGVLTDYALPQIRLYDAVGINANKVQQRLISDDKFLFLPAPGLALGATLWGATLEAQQPEYGLAGGQDLGGIVIGAFINKPTPIQVITIGGAIALPMLGNPNATLVADVL